MLPILFKTLILLWPFLKRAIFKDESPKDFLLKNKQFVALIILVVVLSTAFMHLLNEYNYLKSESCRSDTPIGNEELKIPEL